MNPGMLGLPGFSPEVAAGPWGNAAIPIRAVCNGTQLVISARSRDGGMLGSNGPAVVMFPNADPSIGDIRPKTIVQPVPPIVIASGSTMGFSNNVTGRLWVLLVDGLSGPCLAVVNCLSSTTATYPLRADGLISTLALSGGASAALQPYAAAAITSRPCIILGYFTWETALATAGTWNANPGICRLYGPGVPLPGARVQLVPDYRRLTANGTTTHGGNVDAPDNFHRDRVLQRGHHPDVKGQRSGARCVCDVLHQWWQRLRIDGAVSGQHHQRPCRQRHRPCLGDRFDQRLPSAPDAVEHSGLDNLQRPSGDDRGCDNQPELVGRLDRAGVRRRRLVALHGDRDHGLTAEAAPDR